MAVALGSELSGRSEARGSDSKQVAPPSGSGAGAAPSVQVVPRRSELDDLVARATSELAKRSQMQQKASAEGASRRQQVEALLVTTMEDMREEPSMENAAELQLALEAAMKAGVAAKLRQEARVLLESQREHERRIDRREKAFEKLQKQLADAAGISRPRLQSMSSQSTTLEEPTQSFGPGSTWVTSWMSSSQSEASQSPFASGSVRNQKQVERLLEQLRFETGGMSSEGVPPEAVTRAKDLICRVEAAQRKDKRAAQQLSSLFHLEDADKVSSSMQSTLEKFRTSGSDTHKVVAKLEGRVAELARLKKHQDWLNSELDAAAARLDATRLSQLCDQARALKLTVPAEMVALAHELEACQDMSSGSSMGSTSRKVDHRAKLREDGLRKLEAANEALERVEEWPTLAELRAAKEAVVMASQSSAPPNEVEASERRLARLERLHEPRLEIETELNFLLDQADGPGWHTLLLDGALVERLREALRKAEKAGVDGELRNLCQELLQRTLEAEDARRAVVLRLQEIVGRVSWSDSDLEVLAEAVEEGKRYGVDTFAAERLLSRGKDVQVNVAVAEAELREAAKGVGPSGRARLERALKSAKAVGVSAEKLHEATSRLEELARHEQKCSLLAGNIRRALPTLDKEPWHLEPLMDTARQLDPWTSELEKLVRAAQNRVDKTAAARKQRTDLEEHIRRETRNLPLVGYAAGSNRMEKLLERGRLLSLDPTLLQEAGERLRSLRREEGQLRMAERQLRLAVTQKDLRGIERGMHAVRQNSLGAPGAEGHATGVAGAGGVTPRGERAELPHSERLMEAATTMMRHLGDQQAKRQNAKTALQERLASGVAGGFIAAGNGTSEADTKTVSSHTQDPRCWVKDMKELIQEAKQSGVSPSLIDQARFRVREVQRHEHEKRQACEALTRSLASKGSSAQEVFCNLHRVQRVHGNKPYTAR